MIKIQSKLYCVMILSLWLPSTVNAACAASARMNNNDLVKAISQVQKAKNSAAKTEAAECLARITVAVDSGTVENKVVADMISLLDAREDSVRLWVAVSLGNLGPRAKMASAKLLEILPEVECRKVLGLNSAPAIRTALEKIGATAPPRSCGAENRKAGDIHDK